MGWRSFLKSIFEGIKNFGISNKSNKFMHLEGDDFKHDKSKGPVEKYNFFMNNPEDKGNDSDSSCDSEDNVGLDKHIYISIEGRE